MSVFYEHWFVVPSVAWVGLRCMFLFLGVASFGVIGLGHCVTRLLVSCRCAVLRRDCLQKITSIALPIAFTSRKTLSNYLYRPIL